MSNGRHGTMMKTKEKKKSGKELTVNIESDTKIQTKLTLDTSTDCSICLET